MSVTPIRPDASVDDETRRILTERDATFEQDRKTAVDARRTILNIRRRLERVESH